MNFMFSWQEQQYLTSERSERVKYCSCHENIKFITSRHRVISFINYMARKSEHSGWFFLGEDLAIRIVFMETVTGCVFFAFKSPPEFKPSMARVSYNKLLTNLASSSLIGESWPSVVFVRTSGFARSVLPRPRANIPQNGPRARLVKG